MGHLEYGPLRYVKPTFHVWPSWAYVDHAPFHYVTASDHRSESGMIVPLGTSCLVARSQGKISMTFPDRPYGTVNLDPLEWAIEGAPIIDCVELLLGA
jgi:hypothetical protein